MPPGSMTCYECGEPGHLARDCPNKDTAPDPGDARPEWCRGCDERTRLAEVPGQPGVVRRCPNCHPLAKRRLPQTRVLAGPQRAKARWLRESGYGQHTATPELEAEHQVVAGEQVPGAAEARRQLAASQARAREQVQQSRAEAARAGPDPSGNGHRPEAEVPADEFPF